MSVCTRKHRMHDMLPNHCSFQETALLGMLMKHAIREDEANRGLPGSSRHRRKLLANQSRLGCWCAMPSAKALWASNKVPSIE